MFDAIIVGGGPAGLSAALTLGRARRATLVLDSGKPRNATSPAVHNLFTRDGTPPAELHRIGREQLAAYPTVRVRDLAVTAAEARPGDEFAVRLADGTVERTRRLLLATGLADDLPPIEGLAALWGRGVFHCPYCHGYEARDLPIAVLGSTSDRVRLALHLTRFSDDVVLCSDGPVTFDAGAQTALEIHGVPVRQEPIARVEGRDGELDRIVFTTGAPLARRALFANNRTRQRSQLPAQLGCAAFDDGCVEVGEFGQTGVAGVYAAGDMARRATVPVPVAAAVAAAASGTIAGAVIDQDLLGAAQAAPLVNERS